MFGLSNFIITEFLLIFYSLVTNVLYSYNRTIYQLTRCKKSALQSFILRHLQRRLYFLYFFNETHLVAYQSCHHSNDESISNDYVARTNLLGNDEYNPQ